MRISNFSSMCHFFLISRGRARHLHLIGVKLVKMPKHKLVRHFSTGRALYSDKARSFSQSERALYRNFIIICYRLSLLGVVVMVRVAVCIHYNLQDR